MKSLHKKRQKKNLFEDDEDEDQQNEQVVKKNNDLYQAAKIQKNNQAYIRQDQDLRDNDYSKQISATKQIAKSTKKKALNKRKNLFESEESDKEEDIDTKQKSVENEINKNQDKEQTNIFQNKQEPQIQLQSEQQQEEQKKQEIIYQKQNSQRSDSSQPSDDQKYRNAATTRKKQSDGEEQQEQIDKFFYNVGNKKQQMRHLLFSPIKQGFRAELDFVRIPSGFSESYRLMLKERVILFCENQRGCIGANYYISMTKDMDKKSPAYLGKLRGNSSGSTYLLYDNGNQPNKSLDRSKWRTTLAKIQYETNILGINGPRKLKATAPIINSQQKMDCFKLDENENIDNFQPPNVIKLRNKQPRWNQRLKSFALNFGGRVKLASIKNFIMIDDAANNNEQEVRAKHLLVFGKSDQNTFSLQICSPLSIFQAFGIVMSSFDFKFNCE